jgi:hypothetical protein
MPFNFRYTFTHRLHMDSHTGNDTRIGISKKTVTNQQTVGGGIDDANTSPTLIVACGFTHWTRWRYRALAFVANWTQWSPVARGVRLLCDYEVRTAAYCSHHCGTRVASVCLCFASVWNQQRCQSYGAKSTVQWRPKRLALNWPVVY